jgi:hypothetical protein
MQFDQPQADNPYTKPGDDKLFVQFYHGTLKDEQQTMEQGRPVFKTVPMVKILVPGDRNTVIQAKATAEYTQRFPKQWERFSASQTQEIQGSLLSEVPIVTRAQAEELEYFKVYTVEQLAEAPDSLGAKLPTFHELKRKAAAYVANAKDASAAMRLAEQNEAQANRISSLEAEIARLSTMFEAATKSQVTTEKAPQHGEQHRSGNRRPSV